MRMVVVGGVPGAGKSTALRAYADEPGVLVLDPDPIRARLRWRPLVHAVHQLLVWVLVLAGPADRTLLVHDTATRPRRRGALLRLGCWRGWDVTLLLVDVSRSAALTGQLDRGRLVSPRCFEQHWDRWLLLRAEPETGVRTVFVDRTQAGVVLAGLVGVETAQPAACD